MAKKKAENLLEGVDMLTVPEAAKIKGVTDARIYQWIADGRLTRHTDERFGRTTVSGARKGD